MTAKHPSRLRMALCAAYMTSCVELHPWNTQRERSTCTAGWLGAVSEVDAAGSPTKPRGMHEMPFAAHPTESEAVKASEHLLAPAAWQLQGLLAQKLKENVSTHGHGALRFKYFRAQEAHDGPALTQGNLSSPWSKLSPLRSTQCCTRITRTQGQKRSQARATATSGNHAVLQTGTTRHLCSLAFLQMRHGAPQSYHHQARAKAASHMRQAGGLCCWETDPVAQCEVLECLGPPSFPSFAHLHHRRPRLVTQECLLKEWNRNSQHGLPLRRNMTHHPATHDLTPVFVMLDACLESFCGSKAVCKRSASLLASPHQCMNLLCARHRCCNPQELRRTASEEEAAARRVIRADHVSRPHLALLRASILNNLEPLT